MGGGRGQVPLPRKVVKRCIIVSISNDSKTLSRLICAFFQNIGQLLGLYPQTPTPLGLLSLDLAGDESPRLPNLPAPGKNTAGAHVQQRTITITNIIFRRLIIIVIIIIIIIM